MNLAVDGRILWELESFCTSDLDEEVEQWNNRFEVMMLSFNMMVRSLCCMIAEVRELLTYDGLIAVDEFLRKFQNTVPE